MVLICTRAIRIYLFLQLSYSCLVGITTRRLADSSIPPHLIINKTALFDGAGSSARFLSPNRSSPAAPVNKDYRLRLEGKANGEVRRDASGNEKKRYTESPAASGGVIPLWEENHAGRKYLPPDRLGGTYGPAGLVVAAGGSPLSTPRSYSTESWNAYWKKNQAQVCRDAAENAPPGVVRGTEQDTIDNRDVPLQDTKPVYEFINDESTVLYTDTRYDQRDYERLQGPKGNRARQQSTGPNTVTSLAAHSPRSEPRESTILSDTSAAESASFTIPHWLTDKGYNSPLHPPTNPVISLILSHYGRYVYGTHQPRVYSYMAVNNIHNNRPFGQYKLSHPDEEYEA